MSHSKISKKDHLKILLIDGNEKGSKKLADFISMHEYLVNHIFNTKTTKQLIINTFSELILIDINRQEITAHKFCGMLKRKYKKPGYSYYIGRSF